MRFLLVTAPLLASASLAACSNAWRPPEIKYDDTPRQAVLRADPPKPVKIVELPKPLPLPGQLKPLPGRKTSADPADPEVRVEEANGAARVQPTRAGTYTIICNEYCGINHHTMAAKLYVVKK